MEKVTLKAIAEAAGVSLTTVHRVLNGKGGASKAVEAKILQIAQEQGYAINMAASNLRKAPLHIALVYPRLDKSAYYFINRILDGYGDLSANSGSRAIMRDEAFGLAFLEEYADRLFFATDMVNKDMVFPLGQWLDDQVSCGKLSRETYNKICFENAQRIFKL